MKKISIILFMSILITCLFSSCIHKTVKTEEKDFTKKYYLAKDTSLGALSVEFEIEFPVALANKEVLKSIRSTIITNLFGEEYISHSNDSIIQLFASDIASDYRTNNRPLIDKLDSASSYSFNNEHTLSGFSLLSDKNIYAYGIERYIYMGGAHGLETRNYFNFDLKTGKLITEKDLFIKDYQTALSDLLKKRIIEQSKEDTGTEADPILSLEDTDFWTDSIKGNGNFYITDESINYVFNPYEIAPYFMGETEIILPFNRITKLLKPNSPIAYLIEKQAKQPKE
jgi:hypothetical protein